MGFDMLSLANNHANDFGKQGKQNTLLLDSDVYLLRWIG